MAPTVCVYDDHRCTLGEGPIWVEGALVWVDVPAGRVHRRTPGGERQSIDLGQSVGCVVEEESGGLIAGLREGIARFSFEKGIEQWLSRDLAGEPDRRCNDGAVGPGGRFWVGSMLDDQARGTGRLHLLLESGRLGVVREGLTIPNGLAWNEDGTVMYHIDSPRRVIEMLRFDAGAGCVHEVIGVIQTPEDLGYPDGMAIDAEGMLWVAHWGGGCVSRWDPGRREMVGLFAVPAEHVTSCCFGGDDRSVLFMTTAAGQSENGGAVFACEPGVRGARSYRLRGFDPKSSSGYGA
ncbi:MAG: SMP-30/gluconolactonase/LRE family protein [Phycisphaerales bacterium JB065]